MNKHAVNGHNAITAITAFYANALAELDARNAELQASNIALTSERDTLRAKLVRAEEKLGAHVTFYDGAMPASPDEEPKGKVVAVVPLDGPQTGLRSEATGAVFSARHLVNLINRAS